MDFISTPFGHFVMMLMLFVLHLALPIYFILQLFYKKWDNFWIWAINVTITGFYLLVLSVIGSWVMTYGEITRNILTIGFGIAVIQSLYRLLKKKERGKVKLNFTLGLNIVTIFFLSQPLFKAYGEIRCPNNYVDLEFPLRGGRFCVTHGGAGSTLNHHYVVSAQKYALDITQTNLFGFRSKKLYPKKLKEFYVYEAEVLSPCDGIILKTSNCLPDLPHLSYDANNPAGNYIAIKMRQSDVVVVLAHLKEGSIKVSEGDYVEKGQSIAQVGNTGNTTEPHLHIHAVKASEKDYLFESEGIAMKFNHRFLIRNNKFLRK